MNYQQELSSLAHRYAGHTLPVCVYGTNKEAIHKWIQLVIKNSACETVVIDDIEHRSFDAQKKIAKELQKNDQRKRSLFVTSASPYELVLRGALCQEMAVHLSTLPVEL